MNCACRFIVSPLATLLKRVSGREVELIVKLNDGAAMVNAGLAAYTVDTRTELELNVSTGAEENETAALGVTMVFAVASAVRLAL